MRFECNGDSAKAGSCEEHSDADEAQIAVVSYADDSGDKGSVQTQFDQESNSTSRIR